MRRPVSRFVLTAAIVPLMVLSACGDDDTDTSTGDTVATTETTTEASSADTTAPPGTTETSGVVEVGTGETEFGAVLTAPDGKTLYIFDDDVEGVPTCTDAECTEKWPPLLGDGASLSEVAAESEITLGTAERPDGTTQITVNGRPAYTMEIDRPGEALCQGGDGLWWIIGADGEPIRDDA